MGKIAIHRLKKTPVFRKIAMGSWQSPSEASVYSRLDIDMSKALPFMEEYSRQHGVKLTPVHLVGMAVKKCMIERPEINGLIRGSKVYLRDKVALFFTVNIPGKDGDKVGKAILSGATLEDANDMTLADIARGLQTRAEIIRDRRDQKFEKNFKMIEYIPWFLMGRFLTFVSWLTYGLNMNFGWLGIPKDPFGSVLITNVGSLGVDLAYAPLIPYSRIPLLMAVGALRDMPFCVDGQVVARPGISIGVTFDHRLMDGAHSAQMNRTFKMCFEDPAKYLSNP